MSPVEILDQVVTMAEEAGVAPPLTLEDATGLRDLIRATLSEHGHTDCSVECYHRHSDLIVQVWYGPGRASTHKRVITAS